MKTKFTVVLSALLLALVSCNETTTVSSVMPYEKGIELFASSSVVSSSNPKLKALLEATQMGVAEVKRSYDKKWDVPFSGASVDEALAVDDAKATEGYDKALVDLKKWQQTFQETIAAEDFGSGSFKLSYRVFVKRDKVLQESEPIVFQYPKPL